MYRYVYHTPKFKNISRIFKHASIYIQVRYHYNFYVLLTLLTRGYALLQANNPAVQSSFEIKC